MKFWKSILGIALFSGFAIAGSNTRVISTDQIKTTLGSPRTLWTIQNGEVTDSFVGLATVDTLVNKSMNGSANTFTNLPATGLLGVVPIVNGGTGQSSLGNLTDPGTDGITVTGGTGATIINSSLSQHVADASDNGYLASADWSTFNNKQPAGSYITALTGDVTAAGPGSSAASLTATTNTTLTSLANLATVGSITSGTWGGTTIAIAHGGTNAVSAAAGTIPNATSTSASSWTATPTLGVNATTSGTLALANGSTGGGSVTFANGGTTSANAWTFTLPATECSSGQLLASSGNSGAMTCVAAATNPMSLANQMIYGGSAGAENPTNAGTAGQIPMVNAGATAISMISVPGNSTLLKPITRTNLTSTGTQTGRLFTVTGWTGTIVAGDTYTNNGNTYTAQATTQTNGGSGQTLWMSGTGATSGTTLTKAVSASGPATITFSATVATATYTTPSAPAPIYLKIRQVGAGGAGGGSSGGAAAAGTAGSGTFFGALLLVTNGGSGGGGGTSGTAAAGGAGGSASITSPALGQAWTGGSGCSGSSSSGGGGMAGPGGSSPFGGAGTAGGPGSVSGTAAQANTGSGGGGGPGVSGANQESGAGGAGGYLEAFVSSPATSYPYVVGTGGTGSGSTVAGGAGGSGIIIVEEYYQ